MMTTESGSRRLVTIARGATDRTLRRRTIAPADLRQMPRVSWPPTSVSGTDRSRVRGRSCRINFLGGGAEDDDVAVGLRPRASGRAAPSREVAGKPCDQLFELSRRVSCTFFSCPRRRRRRGSLQALGPIAYATPAGPRAFTRASADQLGQTILSARLTRRSSSSPGLPSRTFFTAARADFGGQPRTSSAITASVSRSAVFRSVTCS